MTQPVHEGSSQKRKPALYVVLAAPGWIFGLLAALLPGLPSNQAQGFGMLLGIIGIPATAALSVISISLALNEWLHYRTRLRGGNAGKSPALFLALINMPYFLLWLYFMLGVVQVAAPNNSPADSSVYSAQAETSIWKAVIGALLNK